MKDHFYDFIFNFPQHKGRPHHISIENWKKLDKGEKAYQAKQERARQIREYQLKQLSPEQLLEYNEYKYNMLREH